MKTPHRLVPTLLGVALGVASLGASCGQRLVTLMPGVVNDAGNRSLRRGIVSFATERLCSEMTGRSLPLRMSDSDPSIGRFFPTGCAVTQLGNENLFVQFVGHGYGWTNVTGRVGFEAAASVEYDHDFLVEGSSMYVYFAQARTQSSSFRPVMLERSDGGVAGAALSMLGRDASSLIEPLGQRILQSQLARGFTVVRDSDGAVAFSLGVLEKGQRPLAPFDVSRARAVVLANDRTEVHPGQRDFVGPFEITDGAHQLVLSAAVEGVPAVDLLVVPRTSAEAWMAQYEHYARTGPAPFPPLLDESIAAPAAAPVGAPVAFGGAWRRELALPPGSYFLVIDHSATAGRTSPMVGDPRAALVNYVVQLTARD